MLPLLIYPDPKLKKISARIEEITRDLPTLVENMFDTMYQEGGIGLAAPQIDVHQRLVVMDIQSGQESKTARKSTYHFINPEIIDRSEEIQAYREGCLSIPGIRGLVRRPAKVKVRFQNLDGAAQEEVFTGLEAVCIQHEIDHLNGILFIDHLSPLQRKMALNMNKFGKRPAPQK